jgi:hypothetical protein
MQLARSRDGRSWAAWVPVGIVSRNVESTVYKYRLYVQTPGDTEPKSMLEWNSSEGLRWFEFSPDGSRLALLLFQSLHVVELDR